MKKSKYTRISFYRIHLFDVCKFGFIAKHIGNLWCEGFIPTARIEELEKCVKFELV